MVKCGDCRFWDKYKRDESGSCCRWSPKVFLSRSGGVRTCFPSTRDDDACGEGVLKGEEKLGDRM